MRRTCQTAQAIASAVRGCKFEVLPSIYEVGGIYRAERPPNSSHYVKVPASGMCKADFQREFPGFDVSQIPDSGSWDGHRGYEVRGSPQSRLGSQPGPSHSPRRGSPRRTRSSGRERSPPGCGRRPCTRSWARAGRWCWYRTPTSSPCSSPPCTATRRRRFTATPRRTWT